MNAIECNTKNELITALRQSEYAVDVVRIHCGEFKIKLRSYKDISVGPWEQSVFVARQKGIKRLIKRIKKQPAKLFKVKNRVS